MAQAQLQNTLLDLDGALFAPVRTALRLIKHGHRMKRESKGGVKKLLTDMLSELSSDSEDNNDPAQEQSQVKRMYIQN